MLQQRQQQAASDSMLRKKKKPYTAEIPTEAEAKAESANRTN